MAFFEELFPRRISAGARGGPVFVTQQVTQPNGFRTARKQRLYPLHEYDVSHAVRTNSDFEQLRAWFYAVSGRFDGFRFEDPSDFNGAKATTSLTDLGGGNWQLNRIYVAGARTFVRPIYKPRSGVVIYDSGDTPLTATVDTTNGEAAVTGTPSYWIGKFDVPVAFADDEAVFNVIGTSSMLVEWPSIRLKEIREDFS